MLNNKNIKLFLFDIGGVLIYHDQAFGLIGNTFDKYHRETTA